MSPDQEYLAVAERRDCKDSISLIETTSWQLVKVWQVGFFTLLECILYHMEFCCLAIEQDFFCVFLLAGKFNFLSPIFLRVRC